MLGGDLKATSQTEKGSTLRMEVVATLSDESELEATEPRPRVIGLAAGQAVPKVLIVDDLPENRALLAAILGDVGIETLEAEDGGVRSRSARATRLISSSWICGCRE